jgi:hypothetical protein
MIARIQIKGNAAEVLVDEVDTISLKEPKKWFGSPSGEHSIKFTT